jgi:hypothetical protein
LQKQKFLFTTPCPSVRKEIVEPLIKFMKAGGWIIASADDCLLDEQMRSIDARSVLFGIQEESSLVYDSQIVLDVNLPDLPGGASLPSAWHRIGLTQIDDGVHVIGHWGDQTPAIILKVHGKGGALYIGTNPYRAALLPGNHQEWPRFFRSVVESPILNDLVS